MDFVLYPLDVQTCAVDFGSCRRIVYLFSFFFSLALRNNNMYLLASLNAPFPDRVIIVSSRFHVYAVQTNTRWRTWNSGGEAIRWVSRATSATGSDCHVTWYRSSRTIARMSFITATVSFEFANTFYLPKPVSTTTRIPVIILFIPTNLRTRATDLTFTTGLKVHLAQKFKTTFFTGVRFLPVPKYLTFSKTLHFFFTVNFNVKNYTYRRTIIAVKRQRLR